MIRNLKYLLSILLFCTIGFSASAQDASGYAYTEVGNFKYTIDLRHTIKYVYCSGLADGVTTVNNPTIPTLITYEGEDIEVSRIEKNAFYKQTGLTGKLILPSALKYIEESAFEGCSGLTGTLDLPESVQIIKDSAFKGCSGFTGNLVIPDNVQTLGGTAYGGGAFEDCTGFNGTLTLGAELRQIGEKVFKNCSGLTGSIVIPNKVNVVGYQAFYYCTGFNGTLTLSPAQVTIAAGTFNHCTGLKGDLIIPNKVWNIGEYAFLGCSGFDGRLVIPYSVTSIEQQSFVGCKNLKGDLTLPNSVAFIGDWAFADCPGFNGKLTLPNNIPGLRDGTFSGCSGLTGDLVIPSSVQTICRWVFQNCSGFTGNLTLPESVTSIGVAAFKNCSAFTGSLDIAEGISAVSDSVFAGCVGITKLSLPQSLNQLSAGSFTQCAFEEITSLNPVPPTVTKSKAKPFSAENNSATLLVPYSSIDAYKSSNVWQSFAEIQAVVEPEMSISKSRLALVAGGQAMLRAKITEVKNPVIRWGSSNESVATVSADGTVNAIAAGVAIITASVDDFKVSCVVSVVEDVVEAELITLNFDEITIIEGESEQLIATIEPEDVTDHFISWSSSDESIVTVSQEGEITAIAPGNATITVATGNISTTCTVIVTAKPEEEAPAIEDTGEVEDAPIDEAENEEVEEVPEETEEEADDEPEVIEADGISLNEAATSLEVNRVIQLTAVVTPEDTTDKSVSWSSSDESVAKVSQSGEVTAIAPGTVTITASCGSFSATCTLTVTAETAGIDGISSGKIDLTDAEIYNLQGHRITRKPLRPGIYIIRSGKGKAVKIKIGA